MYKDNIQQNWTPTLEVTKKFQFKYYHFFTNYQKAISNLASARTVHKAQGCTLSSAVIHLGYQKI